MISKQDRVVFFALGSAIVVFVLVFALGVAHASEGPVSPSQDWLVSLAMTIGNLILAIGGWLLTKILTDKQKAGVLGRAGTFLLLAARELYQTEIQALKEARADGKLTAEEKDRFSQLAIDKAKEYLGAKGLSELLRIFGANELVDGFLKTTLEAGLAVEKKV